MDLWVEEEFNSGSRLTVQSPPCLKSCVSMKLGELYHQPLEVMSQ